MARSLSLVRLVAVLVAAFALAGALPATRYASLAQDASPEAEESADPGAPPVEESLPPGGEPDPNAAPTEEPPTEEPPTEEPAADEPAEVGEPDGATDGGDAGASGEGATGEEEVSPEPPIEGSDSGEALTTGTPESTDVPNDEPTAGVAAADFSAAAVTVTVVATDGTDPVGGGIYTIFVDLGGGATGDSVSSVADGDFDGTADFPDQIDPGNYVLFVSQVPSGFVRPANQSFTVGDEPVSLSVVFTAGQSGSFTARKFAVSVDEANLLGGSCFSFHQDLDPDPGEIIVGPEVTSQCDIGDQDPGFVLGANASPGNYVAIETSTPAGFLTAPDQEFTVVSSQDTPVDVVDQIDPGFDPGAIVVTKVDESQNILTGACFTLFNDNDPDLGQTSQGSQVTPQICDGDDGADDGETTLDNLPAGQFVLRETVPPDGFQAADTEAVVVAGETTDLTIVNFVAPPDSGFVFNKTFEGGTLPDGQEACFGFYVDLDPDPGEIRLGELIAGGTGFCTDEAGQVLSRNQEPGNYVVKELVTPDGYRTSAPIEIVIVGEDEVVEVTMANEFADPDDPATLEVSKLGFVGGVGSSPLAGACFRLFEDVDGQRGDPVTAVVCDADDGADDGFISLTAQAGDYVLGEIVAPFGFSAAADALVTLEPGQVHAITVTNLEQPIQTGFVFSKEFEGGPLPSGEEACFEFRVDLDPDSGEVDPGDLLEGSGQLCTAEDGEVLSRNQEPGFYVVIEVVTPDGYLTSDPVEIVIEGEGDLVEVTMVNELEEPAPTATATTAPAGPTATTAVSELPSTGTGPSGDGGLLLLFALLLFGCGATGWGLRLAVSKRAA